MKIHQTLGAVRERERESSNLVNKKRGDLK